MTKELKKKILSIIAIVVLGCVLIGSGAWIGWTVGTEPPQEHCGKRGSEYHAERVHNERCGLQHVLGGVG